MSGSHKQKSSSHAVRVNRMNEACKTELVTTVSALQCVFDRMTMFHSAMLAYYYMHRYRVYGTVMPAGRLYIITSNNSSMRVLTLSCDCAAQFFSKLQTLTAGHYILDLHLHGRRLLIQVAQLSQRPRCTVGQF